MNDDVFKIVAMYTEIQGLIPLFKEFSGNFNVGFKCWVGHFVSSGMDYVLRHFRNVIRVGGGDGNGTKTKNKKCVTILGKYACGNGNQRVYPELNVSSYLDGKIRTKKLDIKGIWSSIKIPESVFVDLKSLRVDLCYKLDLRSARKLRYLEVKRCEDIICLGSGIRRLVLKNCDVRLIKELEECVELESVYFEGCRGVELSRFEKCHKLMEIVVRNCSGCREDNLREGYFFRVTLINFSGNVDLGGIRGANILEIMGCEYVWGLKEVEGVVTLKIKECRNLKFDVGGCCEGKLRHVVLGGMFVDFSWFDKCENLHDLRLERCENLRFEDIARVVRKVDSLEIVGCVGTDGEEGGKGMRKEQEQEKILNNLYLEAIRMVDVVNYVGLGAKNVEIVNCGNVGEGHIDQMRMECVEKLVMRMCVCFGIIHVGAHGMNMRSIVISNCAGLKKIDVSGCRVISSIVVKGCNNLKNVSGLDMCRDLKFIDFSKCINLKSIGFGDLRSLYSVILNGCVGLENVKFGSCGDLKYIDFGLCHKLRNIVGLQLCEELNYVNFLECRKLNSKFLSELSFMCGDLYWCQGKYVGINHIVPKHRAIFGRHWNNLVVGNYLW